MLRDRMQDAADRLGKRLLDACAVAILVGMLGAFLIRTWPDGAEIALVSVLFVWAAVRCVRLAFERYS